MLALKFACDVPEVSGRLAGLEMVSSTHVSDAEMQHALTRP